MRTVPIKTKPHKIAQRDIVIVNTFIVDISDVLVYYLYSTLSLRRGKMQFDSKIPIYIQIIDFIKKDIIKGKLKPGEKLPSIRDISIELKVNPNTIQRVYQELERENITYTLRGTGTFVSQDENTVIILKKEMSRELVNGFISSMKDIGFNENEIIDALKDKLK